MSSTSAPTTVATAADPARRSSQSISVPCASISDDMKDITATASNRQARASQIYTRKRPSPHGVHKSSSTKTPMLYPTSAYLSRKSPRSLKRTRESQREAHLAALRREGIFIEDEYREEIRQYMHYMEVRHRIIAHMHPLHLAFTALHGMLSAVHGPTTGDPVAYAPLPCRLPG